MQFTVAEFVSNAINMTTFVYDLQDHHAQKV